MEPAGMKGGCFFRLEPDDLVKLPSGSEMFMLPERSPVAYLPASGTFIDPSTFFAARYASLHAIKGKPRRRPSGEKYFAVAAFVSPGFTITHNSAYRKIKSPRLLPLFAYAAAAFYKGNFYAAAVGIDRERRQDLRCMDIDSVRENAGLFGKIFPDNKLLRHLRDCALVYGCPAAKNFFLHRYEAPLPTSPFCNAACAGCISYQPKKRCSITQPRIRFIPTPEEVSEIALFHINNTKDPVVSFGQGCEGEPLLVSDVLEKSIRIIRKNTAKGVINLNTNASRPRAVGRLFDCGLDSMRVSLNSAQEMYYSRYYKPKGYKFKDVAESIRAAKKRRGFVSINYLTMPGFTDLKDEHIALKRLLRTYDIDMIQWRNLNFDPAAYFRDLRICPDKSSMLGVKEAIKLTTREFPALMMGYFNPSRVRMRRRG